MPDPRHQTTEDAGQTAAPERFVNEKSIVSADWLTDRLDDPGVKIVDTRYTVEIDDRGRFNSVPGRDSYLESHIPGSVFLDLDDLRDPDVPTSILDPEGFAEVVGQLGIGNEDEVVVYDTEGGTWAARLWWALRLRGHTAVRILDGGFTHWVDMSLPVDTGQPSIEPSVFLEGSETDLRVEMDDVICAMREPRTVLVDALPEPFYTGQFPLYPHIRAGHIPGARNVSALENLNPVTWRLLPAGDLAELWAPVIAEADRIITYCGAGVYGAFDLFILHLLGHDATLYDGSLEEWGAHDHLPIETGPDQTREEKT